MNATTLILLLLLLACPLSMLFMHRGGGHAHGSHDDRRQEAAGPDTEPAAPDASEPHGGCGHAGHGGGSRRDHSKSGTPA